VDVAAARASCLLARGDAAAAHAASSAALARDPAAPAALLLPHLAACVALSRKADLFLLAHRLIGADPGDGLAWHAAGCYYTVAGAPAAARRHFGRAVSLAPGLAPAWVALGHAAAALDESDAALAAYRSAARLFPGCAAPLVGMACEHARTGAARLAEAVLGQAHATAPGDPAPCHELAALCLRPGAAEEEEEAAAAAALEGGAAPAPPAVSRSARAAAAEAWARAALARAPRPLPRAWAPSLVLLGHALRRQRRLGEAAAVYERAAALDPADPVAPASLGLARHAAGDTAAAAGAYHTALGLAPGDGMVAGLLADALRAEAGRAVDWIGGGGRGGRGGLRLWGGGSGGHHEPGAGVREATKETKKGKIGFISSPFPP
jgi:anaphase-promoting complex subunit 6